MFYQIKRFFKLKLKELENDYITLKKRRDIAKAYNSPFSIIPKNNKVSLYKKIFLPILKLTVVASLIFGVYLIKTPSVKLYNSLKGSLKIEKSKKEESIKRKPKKSIVKKIEPKSNEQKSFEPIATTKIDSTVPKDMKYFLFANKALKKMYLMEHRDNRWIIKKSYPVAIGADPARKLHTGDKRTPEGLYFIIGRQEANELNKIYGPLAYMLNYPNDEDKKAGRTGQGIWIHGTAPDTIPYETKGCLEMYNSEISDLSKFLKRGIGTPILIVSDSSITNPTTYPNFIKAIKGHEKIVESFKIKEDSLKAFVTEWSRAWSSRDITIYQNLYDKEKFSSRGMNWDSWMEYKDRTFNNYTLIDITVDNIHLTDFSDSTAIVKFMQHYKSNKFSSVNGKRLLVIKRKGSWKIYNEISINKEEILL